jgi:hypothetical protein
MRSYTFVRSNRLNRKPMPQYVHTYTHTYVCMYVCMYVQTYIIFFSSIYQLGTKTKKRMSIFKLVTMQLGSMHTTNAAVLACTHRRVRSITKPGFFSRAPVQGCQMVYFQNKNKNLGKFWRVLQRKMLVHIFYITWVDFTAIWYILCRFDIF